MKKTILQISGVFFMMTLAFQSQSQVTIGESDYPRPMSFIDSIYRSTESTPALPTEGAAQVWDYSNLILEELIEVERYDVTNDPDFPNALNGRIADLIFQGFIIESDAYEGIDSEGWYEQGRYTFDVGYSITNITGGPNDSLAFPETAEIFDGRINYLKFPVDYQNQWTESRLEEIPFLLSVAAFGLDKTPGARERTITDIREVVAYGSLTLPEADGTPTSPMEVLLIKSVKTEIDSIFLGGAPAPPALLSAFGLTQGVSTTETAYIFYKPGFGAPVMSIDEGDNKAFYRPQAADELTATKELNLENFKYFPNPVSAGQTVTLITENNIGSGAVSFVDLAGRKDFQVDFESEFGNEIQVDIPAVVGAGMYIYQVLDEQGVPVGLGKLQIE